jgi:hypothetical protein
MKSLKSLSLAIIAVTLSACGNPGVNINNAPYQPKIAVEGYLYCGQTVKDIRLMRNVPIGTPVDAGKLSLTPSGDYVTATINGSALSFDPQTQTYYNDQMAVEYGKSYKLEVSAKVDGVQLHTTSTTTTPLPGFAVAEKALGTFRYNSDSIAINFTPSPGTTDYIFSVVPDSVSTANFIYNNVFTSRLDSSMVAKNINNYKFGGSMLTDISPQTRSSFSFKVENYFTWFYTSYRVIVYAADKNFANYVLTAPSVQEFDGNFHEPVLIFQGDGIGVFASAIIDTVRFTIRK